MVLPGRQQRSAVSRRYLRMREKAIRTQCSHRHLPPPTDRARALFPSWTRYGNALRV